jgi:hypothetical protein
VLPRQLGNTGIISPRRLSQFRKADNLHFSSLKIRADFRLFRSQNALGQPLHQIGTLVITFWPSFKRGIQRVREGLPNPGERTMTRLVIDVVLFSCMSAFVIGIVIAAANLLI